MSDSLSEEMQKWLESLTPEERAILEDKVEVTPTQVIIEDLSGIHDKIIEENKMAEMFKCDFIEASGNACGKAYKTKQAMVTHKQWHTRSKSELQAVRAAKSTNSVDYKKATETLQKENADLYKQIARLEKQIKSLLSENDTLSSLQAELDELKGRYERAVQDVEYLRTQITDGRLREQHLKDKLMTLQERFIDKLDGGS